MVVEMKMTYDITSEDRTNKCEICNRSQINKVTYVYKKLDSKHKKIFDGTCFGKLIGICDMKAHQIVHHLVMRSVKSNESVLWFMVRDKPLRFSLKEFATNTGFIVGDEDTVDKEKGKHSRIVKTYFKDLSSIKRNNLLQAFNGAKDKTDQYKFGLLVVLPYVVLAREDNISLEWWWFDLVDNLDASNM